MSHERNELELSRLINNHQTIKTMVDHFNWSAEAIAAFWKVRIPIAVAFLAHLESDMHKMPAQPQGDNRIKPLPTEEIVKAYQDRQSIGSLAKQYRVSNSTIKSRLISAGVTLRGVGRQKTKP